MKSRGTQEYTQKFQKSDGNSPLEKPNRTREDNIQMDVKI